LHHLAVKKNYPIPTHGKRKTFKKRIRVLMKTLGVIPVTNDKYFLSIFNLSSAFSSQYAIL